MRRLVAIVWVLGGLGGLGGCADDAAPDDGGDVLGDDGLGDDGLGDDGLGDEAPTTYGFESRFEPGSSSVDYAGQVFRHVLIADLTAFIGALTDDIDGGRLAPTEGQIEEALAVYYDFDGATTGADPLLLSTTPEPRTQTYDELSSGKTLNEKIAGNDMVGQHRDWSEGMPGWGGGDLSPEALVRQWFAELDRLAVDRTNNIIPMGPDGVIDRVYVTADGRDLMQLLQKFLLGAVAFSQAADDYLDDDTEGKGLLSDNTDPVEGKPYTALEHAWDEGFGYFGAARDYGDYTDDEIAGAAGREGYALGYHDSNGDGAIDLLSEYNFGHARNAGKRDRGSVMPTDMSRDAFDAFVRGRAIIADADGPLDDAAMMALKAERDRALAAWEKAIAATVVHYVNETLQDMGKFDTDDYSFLDHAKHWSELKGFALSLQFNRRSPMQEGFVDMHDKLGSSPVLADAGGEVIEAYRADLLAVRDGIGLAYGFASDNLGGANGAGGW